MRYIYSRKYSRITDVYQCSPCFHNGRTLWHKNDCNKIKRIKIFDRKYFVLTAIMPIFSFETVGQHDNYGSNFWQIAATKLLRTKERHPCLGHVYDARVLGRSVLITRSSLPYLSLLGCLDATLKIWNRWLEITKNYVWKGMDIYLHIVSIWR